MSENLSLSELFVKHKEASLQHRYITNAMIEPLLKKLPEGFRVTVEGYSVNNLPIYQVKGGRGKIKVLMWSQMHGNESTTTKAIFDILNSFRSKTLDIILNSCELCMIPILNPDGAQHYTRHNANDIDLNRDAQELSQPESKVLRSVFETFGPDFCFNLHGQRTIFSAGKQAYPATLSFLSPAQDEACSLTANRKTAMALIALIVDALKNEIPNQIGIYDDAFNLNCVGDTFQGQNVPTLLFEAGHYKSDYQREQVRVLMYKAILKALYVISDENELLGQYEPYFDIPKNEKLFYDIIIRNVKLHELESTVDIAIQYEERLISNRICFIPKIEKIEKQLDFYAHRTIEGKGGTIKKINGIGLAIEQEVDAIIINDEKYSLNLDKS